MGAGSLVSLCHHCPPGLPYSQAPQDERDPHFPPQEPLRAGREGGGEEPLGHTVALSSWVFLGGGVRGLQGSPAPALPGEAVARGPPPPPPPYPPH